MASSGSVTRIIAFSCAAASSNAPCGIIQCALRHHPMRPAASSNAPCGIIQCALRHHPMRPAASSNAPCGIIQCPCGNPMRPAACALRHHPMRPAASSNAPCGIIQCAAFPNDGLVMIGVKVRAGTVEKAFSARVNDGPPQPLRISGLPVSPAVVVREFRNCEPGTPKFHDQSI